MAAKPQEALSNVPAALAHVSLMDANKYVGLINNRTVKGRGEKQGLGFSSVEIFKQLLKNNVKKANSTVFSPSKFRIIVSLSCL